MTRVNTVSNLDYPIFSRRSLEASFPDDHVVGSTHKGETKYPRIFGLRLLKQG